MSEVRWYVYGLAVIGEVCGADRGAALAAAWRAFGGRAERVQSVASFEVAEEEQAVIDRNKRLRQRSLTTGALPFPADEDTGLDAEGGGDEVEGLELDLLRGVPAQPVDGPDAEPGPPSEFGLTDAEVREMLR